LEIAKENGTEAEKEFQKNLSEGVAIAMESLNALADLGAGFTSRAIERYEQEMDAMDDKFDKQKELIEAEVDNEVSKNLRLKELDKERELQRKMVQDKIAKEKKKQAIIDRTAALFQIAIQTAVWATKVGAEASLFGIALQPLIWALGGLNAAAVLAQPIPGFKDGHLEGTYSGQALINDGGNVEVLQRRGGQLEMSTKKNKLINMKRGDVVHKDMASFIDSIPAQALLNASIPMNMSSRQVANANPFDEQFKQSMLDTMARGLRGTKIINDNKAVGDAVRDALAESNYTKNFL